MVHDLAVLLPSYRCTGEIGRIVEKLEKHLVHDLAVLLSSYGCTGEIGRIVEKLEKHSALPRATQMLSHFPACIHNSIDARQLSMDNRLHFLSISL